MEIIQHDNVLQLPDKSQDATPDSSQELPKADYYALVPDGDYMAALIGAEGNWYRGVSPKVVLWFRIDEGDQTGEKLPAYFNVETLDCRRGQRVRKPTFTVGWGRDLTTCLAILFPDRYSRDDLPSKIPEAEIMVRSIHIRARTSKKTHKGQKRPPAFHYSVVDTILGWVE